MNSHRDEHLIDDEDSATNFQLPTLPIKMACGYSFCHKSQPYLRSNESQDSTVLSRNTSKTESARDNEPQKMGQEPAKMSPKGRAYFEDRLKPIKQAYSMHQIDQASQLVKEYRRQADISSYPISQQVEVYLKRIQIEMHDVKQYQKILGQEGWTLQKEKKNLKISSKIQGNTVGVLVEAYLDVKIEYFLQVMVELDLMKNFMPFMEISHLEKIVDRNCRIGHCVNNFPFITRRQSFFQGIGYDRVNHNGTVFMFTRSLHDRPDLQELLGYKVQLSQNAIQLDYKYFILQYKAESPTSGYLKLAINTDLKLSIPMFILEKATEGFGQDFYKNVRKIAKKFRGSEWEVKMMENKGFFDLVERRIQQHFSLQEGPTG